MSQINVNTIRSRTGGPPSLDKGAVVTGIVTATSGEFAGDVTVGGVLTYEDVTNIDSTGIVTAKSGIRVGNAVSPGIGATIDPNGNAVFAGIVTSNSFRGDGSQLTGIDATAIQTGNTSVQTVDVLSNNNYSIDVTASGSSDYTLSGTDRNGSVSGSDPTVTVEIGDTLSFAVNASGHPFYIRVSDGGANVSTPAATNQGAETGTVIWIPNTAGTYYYQCGNHAGMIGTIIVNGGHVKMTTEGTERVRVGPAGQIGISGANYGTSGQVLTSAGSGSAPSWAAVPPGGNVFVAEAEGSIAADKCVQIRTDGKVEQIKHTTTTNATPNTGGNSGYLSNNAVYRDENRLAYDPDNNIYIATYKLTSNDILMYQIGTTSAGGSINWGGETQLSPSSNISNTSLVYAGNSRFLMAYKDGNNGRNVVRIGKVNSTSSVTWSNTIDMDGQSNAFYSCLVALKIADDRVAILCQANNSNARWTDNRWGIVVGDITGDTAWTYRNASGISEDPTQGEDFTAAFNPTDNIIFTVWKRLNYVAYCSSIQVASGNAATITTDGVAGDIVFESDTNFGSPDCIYHPGHNKFITTWERGGNDDLWTKITTVNSSTLAITNGSTIDLTGTHTHHDYEHSIALTLGPGNSITLYWIEQNKRMYAVTDPTFNGTTISWSSKVNVMSGYNDYVESIDMFWNSSDAQKRVICFGETYQNKPTYFTFGTQTTSSNLVHQNHYLGYADQAYTDGQTATIKTYGNNVDSLTGLTAGTLYYVQGDGSLATTVDSSLSGYFISGTPVAGTAMSATKLLIRDPCTRV